MSEDALNHSLIVSCGRGIFDLGLAPIMTTATPQYGESGRYGSYWARPAVPPLELHSRIATFKLMV
jgi:hypothetical protein